MTHPPRTNWHLNPSIIVRTLVLLVTSLTPSLVTAQQPDDDDLPQFKPGLVGSYTGERDANCIRRDPAINFSWRGAAPDLRLAPGPFEARWHGRLFTIEPGSYRLHLYVCGEVQVRLKDQVVLSGKSMQPAWLEAKPLDLPYGYHHLEITYRRLNDNAQIGLFWEGPRFQVEPVPERHLFHDPPQSPDEQFERGKRLTRALRCQACHDITGEPSPLPAAALIDLKQHLSTEWLLGWLERSPHAAAVDKPANKSADAKDDNLSRRMPAFDLSTAQVAALAAYLMRTTDDKSTNIVTVIAAPPVGDAHAGERLFRTTGCLACHRAGHLGQHTLFGGGDLSRIADKRPREFFAAWLRDPAKINPAHRMPVFKLTVGETADLAAYLATCKSDNQPAREANERAPVPAPTPAIITEGQQLFAQHRCAACHGAVEQQAKAAAVLKAGLPFSRSSSRSPGCLEAPQAARHQPGYELSTSQAAAIRSYIVGIHPAHAKTARQVDGAFVLEERNCVGCHVRGELPGMAAQLASVVAADPELAPELPLFTAPALFGVGDKLHDVALAAAIATKHEPLRPWLSIRMPKFKLADDEMQALVRHFVEADRIPDRPASQSASKLPAKKELAALGGRLVNADGFGCTSCHKIGEWLPQKVALNARGTDLSELGQRIRQPWYDRWVRNPARIVPRMEMPSIVAPVRNMLNENLDEQLAAVWHVLTLPEFTPPAPSAIRVVRSCNVPALNEPAVALTDVLEIGKQVFIRPLLIGLPNRHNVLWDLETNRLAGWWLGDTAIERTRGKSWYWETSGPHLLPTAAGDTDLQLRREGKLIEPLILGQCVTEFDELEHVPGGGLRVAHRLLFAEGLPKESRGYLLLEQTFTPMWNEPAGGVAGLTGFRRRIEIRGASENSGLPKDVDFVLSALPHGPFTYDSSHRVAVRADATGNCQVRVTKPDYAVFSVSTQSADLSLRVAKPKDKLICELEYTTDLPVDQSAQAPERPPLPAKPLDVVPGYSAVRLPLSDAEMPISLAWREDGTMIVCSLKGRVCLARDTDGDGLEDQIRPFSDELASPYGAQPHNGAIDVVNKYALLRLHDRDGDGRADRTEVLASGWGYTSDYHDWAVGLERDADGNYYIALPCQQDSRSAAAAHLRGQGLKLSPRRPSPDSPRPYGIEPFCGGLRFPMGLARNREGALFATDNQGNYNPFNELNHLLPGKRYGFINKLEQKPDFQPPLTPPAIDIPHPWTRSVNGIVFLETRPKVRLTLGRNAFGPFEGHLIGCEYDSRQLVRMSLEQVDGVYQGAVYPFTSPIVKGQEPLQGPISCGVSPRGELYIGNIRDSGWGGGANVGTIVRMTPTGELPPGIAEVRATANGFTIDFTAKVDTTLASQTDSYAVSSYRRISTPAYGGPDVDRQAASVKQVVLSPDGKRATLTLDAMREGFVYELRLANLAAGGGVFHPGEAHYTLHRLPKADAPGGGR